MATIKKLDRLIPPIVKRLVEPLIAYVSRGAPEDGRLRVFRDKDGKPVGYGYGYRIAGDDDD